MPRILTVVCVCASIVWIVGCSKKPSSMIQGKWQQTTGKTRDRDGYEFFQDGTFHYYSDSRVVWWLVWKGTWRMLEGGRLETINGRMEVDVYEIAFTDQTMTLKGGQWGKTTVYRKVSDFASFERAGDLTAKRSQIDDSVTARLQRDRNPKEARKVASGIIEARKAYQTACDAYKSGGDYVKVEEAFLSVRKNFEQTPCAEPSQVYIHMCRAQLAIAARDWARAQREEDSAADLALNIQKKSKAGGPLYEWTRKVKDSIKAIASQRIHRKAFDEAMGDAQELYNAGKYDKAFSYLSERFDEPGRLQADQQEELKKFKNKITRKQSSDECDKLMAQARVANSSDAGTALVAWETASGGLQRLKPHIDAAKWFRMQSEVNKALVALTKEKGLRDIMGIVKNARDSGDNARLLRALKDAMIKPGVPPKVVGSWAAEIKRIQGK